MAKQDADKTVTIDGKPYEFDQLSQEAKTALLNIHATDGELRRLRVQVGIAQTARKAFGEALRAALPGHPPAEGDAAVEGNIDASAD